MLYPTLSPVTRSREVVDRFGGYRHRERIDAGEFYQMENLGGQSYPLLSHRAPRKTLCSLRGDTVLLAKDTLCYPEGSGMFVGGHFVDLGLLPYASVQAVSMGAYIILQTKDEKGNILDKKFLSTVDLSDFGNPDAIFTASSPLTLELCKSDGETYSAAVSAPQPPENPSPMDLWLDTACQPPVLRQFSALDDWVAIESTCVRIGCPGIGAPFAEGDGVVIEGLLGDKPSSLNGNHVILSRGEDHIVISGILDRVYTQTEPISVKRCMPSMDFFTEAGNRLWGCRYGLSADGRVVNEIYASKLGDFKNWQCFEGISTDSYAASVGTDGPFTAAVTHLGYPLFFKENHLHKVYGSYPANFRIQSTALRGVQKGCSRSVATVGEALCYKGIGGVYAYDGALPVLISDALGNESYHAAAAGSLDGRYYISMRDENEAPHLFVYDSRRGIWYREDGTDAISFAAVDGFLYFVDRQNGCLKVMGQGDERVHWMAESGTLAARDLRKKYLSKICLRLTLPHGSTLSVYVRYDSTGDFQHLGTVHGRGTEVFTLPLLPRRCDHFSLRLEGSGDFLLHSLTKIMEGGADA